MEEFWHYDEFHQGVIDVSAANTHSIGGLLDHAEKFEWNYFLSSVRGGVDNPNVQFTESSLMLGFD